MELEDFLAKWHGTKGGAERANYGIFLTEFCQVLGLPDPGPADYNTETRGYQFEAFVRKSEAGEPAGTGRIDLYKPRHFVLEAKQSRLARKATPDLLAAAGIEATPAAPAGQRYDALMRDARVQAENYARALPASEGWPPFLIVCDVGRAFDIYFDWSGMGKDYGPFPDRQSYRIDLLQLRDPKVQAQFRAIWTDPRSIDPRLKAAEVTRDVSKRLAEVSKWLEKTQTARTAGRSSSERSLAVEETALFLMRLLFCMFAEDVELLPKGKFQDFLASCLPDDVMGEMDAPKLRRGLEDLWARMNSSTGDRWAWALGDDVRWFNGGLFENNKVFELDWHSVKELLAAAKCDWRRVEPAIFGTLLEQALTPEERAKLGAHYTPRPYVERLVEATIMESLRAEWAATQVAVAEAQAAGDRLAAQAPIRAFHARLKALRILDPACGTGNFLYVAMELLLRLEGEVLTLLAELGAPAAPGIEPKQFLGLELNPRAAVIAELVLWIGWLRWRIANDPAAVPEPVLQRTDAINFGRHGGYDAVLARMETGEVDFANPRPALWPEADFIVGNPPFIGGKDLREKLGGDYAEALWKANRDVPPSADFVMQWWDRAAWRLTLPGARLQRFGFVTTNSITQTFSRRVIEARLAGTTPISLAMAIADHPWTKVARDGAAVRIAMTVADAGTQGGRLIEVVSEAGLDGDAPEIATVTATGRINADLTLGADVTTARKLKANAGICHDGVKLHGKGFAITRADAIILGLDQREGLDRHVRPYRNGKDLTQRTPQQVTNKLIIDLFGLSEADVRLRFPEIWQHLHGTVRTDREAQVAKSPTSDALAYFKSWWLLGKPRPELRSALSGLPRYIATVDTSKHRIFQFLEAEIICDDKVVVVAMQDGFALGVLSSVIHVSWSLVTGGWMGVGNDSVYVKSRVFDPFPFPDASPAQRAEIAVLGEEIDATRKTVQAEHPDITLTGLYNLVEKLRAGAVLTPAETDTARRARAGIILELHRRLDAAVAAAYGWAADLAPAEIVARLVALNATRAAEEAAGTVRSLRPDYQAGRV